MSDRPISHTGHRTHAQVPPAPPPPPSSCPPAGDDWSRAEMWVMNTLQTLTEDVRETRDTLNKINVRLENHSVKLAFIASISGLVGGILATLIVGWVQHAAK